MRNVRFRGEISRRNFARKLRTSIQIEQVDDTQVGYGLKGVAAPVISATSDWGATVKIFEVQSIAEAMFRDNADPSSAIPETPSSAGFLRKSAKTLRGECGAMVNVLRCDAMRK